jgi:hypothetical protein
VGLSWFCRSIGIVEFEKIFEITQRVSENSKSFGVIRLLVLGFYFLGCSLGTLLFSLPEKTVFQNLAGYWLSQLNL